MQSIKRQSTPEELDTGDNQFLSQYMDYECCPFCARSFFRGKLAYHLKLCSRDHPMLKNKSSTPREKDKKNSLSAASNYERCENCRMRIPSFMLKKHREKCGTSKDEDDGKIATASQEIDKQLKLKRPKPQSQNLDDTIFPRIKNYPSRQGDNKPESEPKKAIRNTTQSIRIRQQLRCLKRAEQVQKVLCEYCGRRFSEQAAQRHIPICHNLRRKQIKEIATSKKSKSFVHSKKLKLNDLIAKNQHKQSHSLSLVQPRMPASNDCFDVNNEEKEYQVPISESKLIDQDC